MLRAAGALYYIAPHREDLEDRLNTWEIERTTDRMGVVAVVKNSPYTEQRIEQQLSAFTSHYSYGVTGGEAYICILIQG